MHVNVFTIHKYSRSENRGCVDFKEKKIINIYIVSTFKITD